jgi:hypothetical protein
MDQSRKSLFSKLKDKVAGKNSPQTSPNEDSSPSTSPPEKSRAKSIFRVPRKEDFLDPRRASVALNNPHKDDVTENYATSPQSTEFVNGFRQSDADLYVPRQSDADKGFFPEEPAVKVRTPRVTVRVYF